VRAVRKLAGYLRRPPDTATVEDLRNFQLHLVDQGASPITLNATITGLKFDSPSACHTGSFPQLSVVSRHHRRGTTKRCEHLT